MLNFRSPYGVLAVCLLTYSSTLLLLSAAAARALASAVFVYYLPYMGVWGGEMAWLASRKCRSWPSAPWLPRSWSYSCCCGWLVDVRLVVLEAKIHDQLVQLSLVHIYHTGARYLLVELLFAEALVVRISTAFAFAYAFRIQTHTHHIQRLRAHRQPQPRESTTRSDWSFQARSFVQFACSVCECVCVRFSDCSPLLSRRPPLIRRYLRQFHWPPATSAV